MWFIKALLSLFSSKSEGNNKSRLDIARELYLDTLETSKMNPELPHYLDNQAIKVVESFLHNDFVLPSKGLYKSEMLLQSKGDMYSVYQHDIIYGKLKIGGVLLPVDSDKQELWLYNLHSNKVERIKPT